jgi:hypothetical protein
MQAQARINITGLQKRVALMRRQLPTATRSALSIVAESMLDLMIQISPSDTQRYKRGWQIVANQLGFPRAVLPVVQSSRRRQQRATLVKQLMRTREQLDYWTGRVNRLQADGHTHWKSYAPAVRFKARAEKVVARAQEVLEEFDDTIGAIVIGGRKRTSGFYGRSNLAAPRPRVFGGRGEWSLVGGEFRVFGEHLEPHARLVEYGLTKRAKRLGPGGEEASKQVRTPAYRVLRTGLQQASRLGAFRIKPEAMKRLPAARPVGGAGGN